MIYHLSNQTGLTLQKLITKKQHEQVFWQVARQRAAGHSRCLLREFPARQMLRKLKEAVEFTQMKTETGIDLHGFLNLLGY